MLVLFKQFFLVVAIMTIPIREGKEGSVLSKGYQEQYAVKDTKSSISFTYTAMWKISWEVNEAIIPNNQKNDYLEFP